MNDRSGQEQSAAGEIKDYFRSHTWTRWKAAREYLQTERQELLRSTVRSAGLHAKDLRVLDIGCGAGDDLAFWASEGVDPAHLFGTELVDERAEQAAARLPGSTVQLVTGFDLPFDDASFGLTTASLVFSTVKDALLRRQLFNEMWRVTRPGGVIAVYDFRLRKPWNRSVVAMNRARMEAVGRSPTSVSPAAPFLPLLAVALRIPLPAGQLLLKLLPHTHAVYTWRR